MKKPLSANALKLIALGAMTLDHIGLWGTELTGSAWFLILRGIGRIAAPVFLFLLTESLRYTSSRLRLLLRLAAGAVLHAAVSAVLMELTDLRSWYGNIFFTLLLTGLAVCAFDAMREKRILSVFGVAAAAVFADLLLTNIPLFPQLRLTLGSTEYSVLFALMGLGWYVLADRKRQMLFFMFICMLTAVVPETAAAKLGFGQFFGTLQPLMALAIPLLLCYDGTRGKSCKPLFYLYYPLHQYALLVAGFFLA